MRFRIKKKQQRFIKTWVSVVVLTMIALVLLARDGFFSTTLPFISHETVHLDFLSIKYPNKIHRYTLGLKEYPSQEFILSAAAEIPLSLKTNAPLKLKFYEKGKDKCLMSISFEGYFLVLGPLGDCLALKVSDLPES